MATNVSFDFSRFDHDYNDLQTPKDKAAFMGFCRDYMVLLRTSPSADSQGLTGKQMEQYAYDFIEMVDDDRAWRLVSNVVHEFRKPQDYVFPTKPAAVRAICKGLMHRRPKPAAVQLNWEEKLVADRAKAQIEYVFHGVAGKSGASAKQLQEVAELQEKMEAAIAKAKVPEDEASDDESGEESDEVPDEVPDEGSGTGEDDEADDSDEISELDEDVYGMLTPPQVIDVSDGDVVSAVWAVARRFAKAWHTKAAWSCPFGMSASAREDHEKAWDAYFRGQLQKIAAKCTAGLPKKPENRSDAAKAKELDEFINKEATNLLGLLDDDDDWEELRQGWKIGSQGAVPLIEKGISTKADRGRAFIAWIRYSIAVTWAKELIHSQFFKGRK